MKDIKILEIMELFDEGEVIPASQMQRPQSALDREMFEDANERFNKAGGGMLVQPSADGSRPGYKKDIKKRKTYTDAIGRTYDVDNMGRPMKLEGKTGKVVKYLSNLPDGAEFYKPDIAKLLNLGVQVKDGKEFVDTSLLTKIISRRPELKNKNFKFLTKTDVTVKKINNFVTNYLNENNGKFPTQGEIVKGAKVDPTKLRTYIVDGLVDNVADTVFDIQTKATNYILNTKKPTISGLEKIVGKNNANKILSRVYINSLKSLNNKINKVDEGRSIYANFNQDQVELLKNKVRRIPGFESVYEREITDLVSDAYPDPKDAAKKKAALKKISRYKQLNKEIFNKFGFKMQLDHPLSFDFITKSSLGEVDPTELIKVRPLPERVNAFKSYLESDLLDISNTLKKGYNEKAYNKYLDMKSIADELKIPFPKLAKTGSIVSAAASKIGTKPLIGDVEKAGLIQNKFRTFVQRLGINLNELTNLSKLPNVDLNKYKQAVKNFALTSGKFGVPFVVAAGGADFLKKEGIGFDQTFEPTASATDGPVVAEGLSTGEKVAAGTAASSLGFKKVRDTLGKTFRTLGTPIAGPLFAGYNVYDKMKSGSSLADAVFDPITGLELSFPALFKENISKITKSPVAQKILSLGGGKIGTQIIPGVGTAITLGSLTTDAAKAINEEANRIANIEDQDLQQLEYENLVKSIKGFAGGGIAGLSGGIDEGPQRRSMNPDSGGLKGLLNRVKKQ
jgi:hypothetical protein